METSEKKQKVIVVVGQTGSGKTALSLALAHKYNGEVINADSRQVYRGLDIGTEKITATEMEGIPHHLLSSIDPKDVYTSAEFKHDATEVIEEITHKEKLPIIAGGTFFYIDTLLGKMNAPQVPPDLKYRATLEQSDAPTLFAELTQKDAARALNIDRHNKRRLMRALEIIKTLGHVPVQTTSVPIYDTLMIGLQVPKEVLRPRLKARAERALDRGLIEETEGLLSQGVSKERLGEIGLEYALVVEYLDGAYSKETLIQKLEEKNWQYAKRQMVWLKRDATIVWHAPSDTEAIFKDVDRFLSN